MENKHPALLNLKSFPNTIDVVSEIKKKQIMTLYRYYTKSCLAWWSNSKANKTARHMTKNDQKG